MQRQQALAQNQSLDPNAFYLTMADCLCCREQLLQASGSCGSRRPRGHSRKSSALVATRMLQ